ncbi:MAG: hypothetical protein HFG28_16155 [Eubacterium sp.]|nr:hypothetical protein [Eubacterium sp.]
MRPYKTWFSKYAWIFLALNFLGIGISCFLESGLGCDPIALLSDGISKAFSVSFGTASFFYNVATIVCAFLFAGKYLGAGTIVYGLLSGFMIDFYSMVFERFSISCTGLFGSLFFFCAGEIMMSAAFAVLMQLNLGMTALDALLTAGNRKTGIPYAIWKMGTDAVFVITGFLLGGSFGAGTIVSAAVTGMLVARIGSFVKRFAK